MQFNLLTSSILKARPDLKEKIINRGLTPSQVATLTSADLASAERLEELERARQTALAQTVKSKEDSSGVRLGRDGFERVEDVKEQELFHLQKQEKEARRRESLRDDAKGEEGMDHGFVESAKPLLSPALNDKTSILPSMRQPSLSMGSPSKLTNERIPSASIPPESPSGPSIAVMSAWTSGAETKEPEEMRYISMDDQMNLDFSDIANEFETLSEENEGEQEDMDLGAGAGDGLKEDERALFDKKPVVWSGGVSLHFHLFLVGPPLMVGAY
jgi:hypothetical protein